MPRSLLKRWGTWLGVGAGTLAVVRLVLVRMNASLDAEMSLALGNERVHIEKMTTVRRGARATHMALLERWLSLREHVPRASHSAHRHPGLRVGKGTRVTAILPSAGADAPRPTRPSADVLHG